MNTHGQKRAAVAALLLLALAYAGVRVRQINGIENQLHAMAAPEKHPVAYSQDTESLKRKFPLRADVPSVVEHLYGLASGLALSNVEITTLKETARPSARRPGADPKAASLVSHPLKISLEGSYRDVALFVRAVEDMERYNRIISLDMKPGKSSVLTTIVIEILSFEVNNAS